MQKRPALRLLSFVFACLMCACTDRTEQQERIYDKPAIVANPVPKNLSPEEALKHFYLPEGYKIELVASEPMVGEPVSISWDANGRMYVAQMMTYMQDVNGSNENAPWSRVSLLEDLDGDGKMDKSSVFIDSLVLPRIVLPLDDRVIIGETFNRSLYAYRDTNGDGIADEKQLLLEDTVRDNRNLEHQDANMLWNIDNWLYVSNKAFRYRFSNNHIIRDTLPEPMPGQWGLTQDETGRLFFSRAGAEIPALGFQQHPLYGSLELKGRWDESFLEPWPIVGTPDAQGGPRRIRPGDNTLNRFTGVAGQEVYLGDKMPGAYGDLFIPEPVGRLVRRAKVEHINGQLVLKNRYHQAEFLASTDPLFRPVLAATGPDGCLYVVDMYRGIIQEGTWVGEGSYLRGVVQENGYDKFVQHGRIYRIYHETEKPGPKPQLLHKNAAELLPYLSHPNGWWRMTAQKLLVLKGDKSIVPALREKVLSNEGFFARLLHRDKDFGLDRLHALWTLDGLQSLDVSLLKKALEDKDARVRAAAIRLCEPYLKQNNQELFRTLQTMAADSDPEVIQQLLLTFRMQQQETRMLVAEIAKRFSNNALIKATAKENLNPAFSQIQALSNQYKLKGGEVATQIINGFRIFQDNCSSCHGVDGRGTPQLAPSLVGSPRLKGDPGSAIRILLHGLTGPVDGKTYNGPMASQAGYTDEELADVLSYVREHLNGSGTIWRGNIRSLREKYKDRKSYWTLEELASESAVLK
jgi:mono/diheme cytochrome c family protein/glucose/arabinose dehydrogenase